MADNRTMAQMLQAPIEGYEDAIVIPPINANNFELKQPLINLVQSNKFTDGEPWRRVKSSYTHGSRASDSRVSTDAPLSNSSPSNNSFDMQQIAASLEDKMTIKMNKMLNEMKALVVTTPAPVKAVEEAIPTKLQVQVLYLAIPFQTQEMEANGKLQLVVVVSYDGPLISTASGWKRKVISSQEVLGFSIPLLLTIILSILHDVDCFYSSPTLTLLMKAIFYSLRKADAFIALDVGTQFHQLSLLQDYSPGIQKDLKVIEPKKSSLEYATSYEPKVEIPEVELKELPPHLEYAFLEENNKLPVIISKDLSQEEKTSLINVLKNRKQAIAWKLSDI
ncbi:hypothetical protein Tco_0385293 [Tanacetum coccineum]